MCITFFYIDRTPNAQIKFVMVHNREEDFGRPTSALGQFEDDKNIFGGRDLREQGTWLGFNAKTQNLAFLTNRFSWGVFRDRILSKLNIFGNKTEIKTISRGKLIQEFVASDFIEKYSIQSNENSTIKYGQTIFQNRNKFMPFNLLVANLKDMEFVFQGNYDKFPPVSLRDGYHTFCNYSSFETPISKQNIGLKRFRDAVQETIQNSSQNMTQEIQKANEKQLINNIHEVMENKQTNFSLFFLPIMNESSIFIKPYYSYIFSHYRGTRTSTVIVLNNKNELTMSENTYYQNMEQPKTNIQMHIQL